MLSYYEPKFIEKWIWESGFPIVAKFEMTQNKNRLFNRHFETVQHSIFFQNYDFFFIVHTYMAQISSQN